MHDSLHCYSNTDFRITPQNHAVAVFFVIATFFGSQFSPLEAPKLPPIHDRRMGSCLTCYLRLAEIRRYCYNLPRLTCRTCRGGRSGSGRRAAYPRTSGCSSRTTAPARERKKRSTAHGRHSEQNQGATKNQKKRHHSE